MPTFSFSSLTRLAVLLAVVATAAAVGVSRLDPARPASRSPRPATTVNINDYLLRVTDRQPRWLDSETGEVKVTPIVADDVLEVASCSPWVDDNGDRQMVGRWSNRTANGTQTVNHAFGLARYSFPGCRVLDRVATEVVPVSPPCWFPGTSARILFVAGDGLLYHFAFEGEGQAGDAAAAFADPAPIPVAWACPRPGGGEVHVCDVSWPDDPRLGGRLLASMRTTVVDPGGARSYSRSRLYWLQLDPAGTQVVAAGPLVDHDANRSAGPECDERSPTVAVLPDGSLGLAFTQLVEGESSWTTRLGALRVEADGRPVAAPSSTARVVAQRSQAAPLAFSADGRFLNVLIGDRGQTESIARIATVAAPAPAPN